MSDYADEIVAHAREMMREDDTAGAVAYLKTEIREIIRTKDALRVADLVAKDASLSAAEQRASEAEKARDEALRNVGLLSADCDRLRRELDDARGVIR